LIGSVYFILNPVKVVAVIPAALTLSAFNFSAAAMFIAFNALARLVDDFKLLISALGLQNDSSLSLGPFLQNFFIKFHALEQSFATRVVFTVANCDDDDVDQVEK